MKSFSCKAEVAQLRLLREGDEALFHALYTDPVTMRFIGGPWTPTKVASKFKGIVDRQGGSNFDDRFLVILEKATQTPLGVCGTSHYDPVAMRLEVGIVLSSEGRRLGIAREALTALVGFAFEELMVDEVYACFAVGNKPARNLVARLGFRPSRAGRVGGKLEEVVECEWSVHRSAWCIREMTNKQG